MFDGVAGLLGGLPYLGQGSLSHHLIYDSPATLRPASDFALPQPVPRLVMDQSRNVTAVQGRGAILNCRVRGIGNRTVRSDSLLMDFFLFFFL